MKKSINYNPPKTNNFGFTIASGNSSEYPSVYSWDSWDKAFANTSLANIMLNAGVAPLNSETGEAQYSQSEINEALAASADSSVKMDIGTDPSQADDNVTIFIDTDDDNSIEVYTKTQIDAMLAGYTQVQRYASNSQFPATGSTGVLYINTTTDKAYEWDGSTYKEANSADIIKDKVGHVAPVTGTVAQSELQKAYTETTPVTNRTYTAITSAQKSAASTGNIAPSDAGWYERSGAGTQADPYVYAASTDTAVGNKTYYIPNEVGQQSQQQINERLAQRANIPLEVWAAALSDLNDKVDLVINASIIIAQINTQLSQLENDLDEFNGKSSALADLAARIATLETYYSIMSRMHIAANDNEIVFKGLPRYYDNNGNGIEMCITGIAAPSVIPSFVGQHYIDTTNNKVYVAKGTTATNQWLLLN